jgi:pilus assembly protein CpaF
LLASEIADEALGIGPLERLLADPTVCEVMLLGPHEIFVERGAGLRQSSDFFTGAEYLRAAVARLARTLGRRLDASSPLLAAGLPDGSRLNVALQPIAAGRDCVHIRKCARMPLALDQLLEQGALSGGMAGFLSRAVRARKNILISGGTGTGKTSLLNVLAAVIPDGERLVAITQLPELQLSQPHAIALAAVSGARPARDLIEHALQMQPDRIVVDECRGVEALDVLQAMSAGHEGSLATINAPSARDALRRLEQLVQSAAPDLPARAIRARLAESLHLIVQQTRFGDGSRKLTAICEVAPLDRNAELRLRPLYEFIQEGVAETGEIQGRFEATGYLPSFLPELLALGLVKRGEPYL